jgi:hypothetical protein
MTVLHPPVSFLRSSASCGVEIKIMAVIDTTAMPDKNQPQNKVGDRIQISLNNRILCW